MKSNRLLFVLTLVVLLTLAYGCAPAATEIPTPIPTTEPTEAPATEPPTEEPVATEPGATEYPTGTPQASEPLSMEERLAQIQDTVENSAKGSISYNVPFEMQVGETRTIELLLNPSLSEEQLREQITEPGAVHSSGDVDITDSMQALLVPQDRDAFTIQARPDEEHSIQLIPRTDTTKWSWDITARKEGPQELTIFLYRLVHYENEDHWIRVNEYTATIAVEVTLADQLKALRWVWIAGLLIALLAVFALWQRSGHRGKRIEQPAGSSLPTEPRLEHAAHDVEGHVFISYRRSDSADIVGRIYDRLVEEFGRDPIFKDVDSIPLGVDFKEYLDQKVSECDVLLAVIGDRWTTASDPTGKKRLEDPEDFVRIEIESALERGIPIIPLLVRGAQMPVEEELPISLKKLVYKNGIPIRPDPDFRNDMKRLISALERYLRRVQRP